MDTTQPNTDPPDLSGLADAVSQLAPLLDRVDASRNGNASDQGGDVGAHGSGRLVTRHIANYLAAVDLARRAPADGHVVDVGSGVGALGVWAAEQLGAPLHLVDPDPAVRAVATRAFPDAAVDADTALVPAGSARLVTAMEVIEHVRPREQPAFVRSLTELLAPGGLLVMSTPDESGYLGGWSGYRPHVGPVSFEEFDALLRRNLSWPVMVWRLEGKPFELGRVRAVAEPAVNRAWGAVASHAPKTSQRAVGVASGLGRLRTRLPRPGRGSGGTRVPEVRASDDPAGQGTGLLGVVRRPR